MSKDYDCLKVWLHMGQEECEEAGDLQNAKIHLQLYEIVCRDEKRHLAKQAALEPMRRRKAEREAKGTP